jgi:hypothetical protein
VVAGRTQWLSARYDTGALAAVGPLVAAGRRRVADVFAARAFYAAGPEEWAARVGPATLADADTPEEFAALLGRRP